MLLLADGDVPLTCCFVELSLAVRTCDLGVCLSSFDETGSAKVTEGSESNRVATLVHQIYQIFKRRLFDFSLEAGTKR